MTVYVLYKTYGWDSMTVNGLVSTLEAAERWKMSAENADYCEIVVDGEIKDGGYA